MSFPSPASVPATKCDGRRVGGIERWGRASLRLRSWRRMCKIGWLAITSSLVSWILELGVDVDGGCWWACWCWNGGGVLLSADGAAWVCAVRIGIVAVLETRAAVAGVCLRNRRDRDRGMEDIFGWCLIEKIVRRDSYASSYSMPGKRFRN